jgi:ParB family chromosome partitioning protein
MAKAKASGKTGAARGRRKKKAEPASVGLSAVEVADSAAPATIDRLDEAIQAAGGRLLGRFRDPLGGHWHVLASLPIEQVAPTPFQRDLSDTHVARLADVIGRMGRYLDPIVVVPNESGGFWTPNGHHRLAAMQRLGGRSILAVVVPEREVAYQILAMNTEKSHNLKEKSLEVVRMARALADLDPRPEQDFALEFEEPSLLTLGTTYEQQPRFAGGAYHPVLRRVDAFLTVPLPKALAARAQLAERLLEIDGHVAQAVVALKERGFTSPYLKAFVVARINPLRFRKSETPLPMDETLDKMLSAAKRFDAAKVKLGDITASGGPPGEE